MEDFTPVSGTPMPLENTPPKADDSGWKKGMSLEGHSKKTDKPKRSGGTLKTVLFSVAWGIVLSYAVVVSVMYYQDYTARYDAGYDEGYKYGVDEEYPIAFREGWNYGHESGYKSGSMKYYDGREDGVIIGYRLAEKIEAGKILDSTDQMWMRHIYGIE